MDNEDEQLLAFNWRNTMPLSCLENLQKNNKILPHQIKEHLEKLKEYHIQKNIELPEIYVNLLVKHLVAGIPLES
jgi:transaldolase